MTKNLITLNLFKEGESFEGFGKLGLEGTDPSAAGGIFNQIISTTVGLMTVIAFVWFIFLLLIGGYDMMQAGGDSKALESAKKKLMTAVQGLLFVIAAIFIIKLLGFLLGIDNILNPALFLENLNK